MTPSSNGDRVPLSLSHEEAWVAHVALLHAGATAVADGDGAPPQCPPLRRLERGDPLTPDGARLLRDALVDYLGDAPVRDRAPGRALLRRVGDRVESSGATGSDGSVHGV